MKRTRSPNPHRSSTGGSSRWSSDEDDESGNEPAPNVGNAESDGAVSSDLKAVSEGAANNACLQSAAAAEGCIKPLGEIRVHSFKHNPLIHGCRGVDNYQRLNYISAGTYGVVYRAQDKTTGDIVALKQIKFDKTEAKTGDCISICSDARCCNLTNRLIRFPDNSIAGNKHLTRAPAPQHHSGERDGRGLLGGQGIHGHGLSGQRPQVLHGLYAAAIHVGRNKESDAADFTGSGSHAREVVHTPGPENFKYTIWERR